MKIVKCGCKMCRRGLRTRKNSQLVTRLRRAARREAKAALRRGEEPETRILVPYTD